MSNKALAIQKAFRPKSLIEERLQITPKGNAAFDIILALINNEPAEDVNNYRYEIDLREYSKYLTDDGKKQLKNIYPILREGFDEIFSKSIKYGSDERGGEFHIISERTWDDANLRLSFCLSPTTKAMLLLEKNTNWNAYYTWRYPIMLSGRYSGNMYYLCKEWEKQDNNNKKGVHTESLEKLRYMLDIPESYNVGRVVKLVEESLKDICDKTDIEVIAKYNKVPVKGGNKIDSVTFTVRINKNLNRVEMKHIRSIIDSELKQYNIELDEYTKYDMTEAAKLNGLKDEIIKQRIAHASKKKKIDNPPGYFRFLMGEDYNDPEEIVTQEFSETHNYEEEFNMNELINNR